MYVEELYNAYMEEIATGQSSVCVFLNSGNKLSGVISAWDEDSFILYRDGISHLVMRDMVATIMPQDPFSIQDIIKE